MTLYFHILLTTMFRKAHMFKTKCFSKEKYSKVQTAHICFLPFDPQKCYTEKIRYKLKETNFSFPRLKKKKIDFINLIRAFVN